MPIIEIETIITAPIERVFDLARSIDLHMDSQSKHNEIAVSGKTSGLISLGECVTWQATHFGISQKLTSKIVLFERPNLIRDSMQLGIFSRFDHDHQFVQFDGCTRMKDVFDYDSPFRVFGDIADFLFLRKYMARLLNARSAAIKEVAEGDDWQKYL